PDPPGGFMNFIAFAIANDPHFLTQPPVSLAPAHARSPDNAFYVPHLQAAVRAVNGLRLSYPGHVLLSIPESSVCVLHLFTQEMTPTHFSFYRVVKRICDRDRHRAGYWAHMLRGLKEAIVVLPREALKEYFRGYVWVPGLSGGLTAVQYYVVGRVIH